MSFLEKWIEYDLNPFILFSAEGKILSLNQEAQRLLSKVSNRELFDLALHYAAGSFGFKTHVLELEYERFAFFAITVGYENEQEIGIRLYKKPKQNAKAPQGRSKSESASLFVLLDLAISSNASKTKAHFERDFDPAIPESLLEVSELLKLLGKIYQAYMDSQKITTRVFMNIGEHIKIESKKHPIIRVAFSGDRYDEHKRSEIEWMAQNTQGTLSFMGETICLDLPLILA